MTVASLFYQILLIFVLIDRFFGNFNNGIKLRTTSFAFTFGCNVHTPEKINWYTPDKHTHLILLNCVPITWVLFQGWEVWGRTAVYFQQGKADFTIPVSLQSGWDKIQPLEWRLPPSLGFKDQKNVIYYWTAKELPSVCDSFLLLNLVLSTLSEGSPSS